MISSPFNTLSKQLVTLVLLSCLSSTAVFSAPTAANRSNQNDQVTLNFDNTAIASIAKTMAVITNRNIVVDPRVKGDMTLMTDKPVTVNDAWNQFLSALRLSKYTIVESAGIFKVVPESEARLQTNRVIRSGGSPAGNQVVTQIFKLNYENVNQVLPILRPLISSDNSINASVSSNTLVITDYADNLKRIAQIIASIDVAQTSTTELVILQNAFAKDVADLINKSLTNESRLSNIKPVVLPDSRSNGVIIRAQSESQLKQLRDMVLQLDSKISDNASGNIRVVYLKNANAAHLATILNTLFSGASASNSSSATKTNAPTNRPGGSTNLGAPTTPGTPGVAVFDNNVRVSGGGVVLADETNNALIINAPESIYRQLRNVIDMLDGRRAQVYVETLIAEVNTNKLADMGIQWQSLAGAGKVNANSGVIGVIGTNYGEMQNGNIIGTAAALAAYKNSGGASIPANIIGQGFNIGAVLRHGGQYVLGALANFIQSEGDGNILSTPTLLTLDNEEAIFVAGKNIPIITGSTRDNTGTPFQTMDRQDVGLTLRVKPQISENGSIQMNIFQEASDIDRSSSNMFKDSGIITSKRSITSKVTVEDGQIIVIGGLLTDSFTNSNSKVPLLGDIPVVGNLFKNKQRSHTKNNLMVFLRPVIVRDAESTIAFSNERYNLLHQLQQSTNPEFNLLLNNINTAPVLPLAQQDIPNLTNLSASAPLINVLPPAQRSSKATSKKKPRQ